MPTPILRAATARGEGPGGGTGGTTGLYERTAPSIPLYTALPSRAQGTPEGEEAELPFLECDLGPPPELRPEVDHFL